MAYKPKYAQQKPVKARQTREPVQPRPRKKMSKGVLVLFIILGIVIIPAASFLTGKLLLAMAQDLGRPKAAAVKTTADMTLRQNFEDHMEAQLYGTKVALTNSEKPEIPEVDVPPVRKVYWIEEDVMVAPEPNQNLFGQSNDPEVLANVLHEARWLLDGQKMYFDPNGQRYADSTVNYYLDDSILAVTWQEVHDGSVYTFSEIKVSHPSQFRRHLADGEYGSDKQYETTEMAATVNAVVASAGDFYRFRDFGAVVYKGEAKRVEGTYAETCYIDANGDMHFTYGGEVTKVQQVQEFVDEHDIRFSLAFGPILVKDSEYVCPNGYELGEVKEEYPRAALCQMDKLHYLFVASNMENPYYGALNMRRFADFIYETGCIHAYALDGGQTASVAMNNTLINKVNYGSQRLISDIIYFATAKPAGE